MKNSDLGGLLGAAILASAMGGRAQTNEEPGKALKGRALIDALTANEQYYGNEEYVAGDFVMVREGTAFTVGEPMIVIETNPNTDLRYGQEPNSFLRGDVFDVRVLRALEDSVIAEVYPSWVLRKMDDEELDAYQGLATKSPAASVGDEEEAQSADSAVAEGPLDDLH